MPDKPRSMAQNVRHAVRLAQKELREILRDRRTIVTLVLMPILVYPLIGVTFQKFLATQLTQQPKIEYRLCYRDLSSAQGFFRLLQMAERLAAEAEGRPVDFRRTPAGTDRDPLLYHYSPKTPEETLDLAHLIEDREFDVGVTMAYDEHRTAQVELVTDEHSAIGRNARRFLEDRFRQLNEALLRERLQELMADDRAAVSVSQRFIPSTAGDAFSLATLVPLILILMTVTGAVYPAIDLTAGERERNTLEALISAPVSRHELLLAKYCAVLAVALLTAVANLVAMTATAYVTGLESLLFGKGGLSFGLVLKVFGVLAAFAGFFSSILLAVTSFARSFKEAQAYLIPVMLVSIAPGILALMPGMMLTPGMALVPLANMVLLTRDLFEGELAHIPAAMALVSTLVYTVIGLILAAKIFGTDAVLYGSSGSWSDVWRRPVEGRMDLSPSKVLACLAVVFPVFLLLGKLLARWVETSMTVWLVGQLVLTSLLFVGMPAVFSVWQKIPLARAFQMRRTAAISWVAAALAGFSLWPFAYEALIWMLPAEQLDWMMNKFSDLESRLEAVPFPVRILVFAIAPAITEELFFRGYLLQGLALGWGRWPAILLSGAIFGAFHVFVEGLSFERFLPTALLGFCLGWICLRTGSVWPGMLVHVLNNGFLLTVAEKSDQLQSWGIGVQQQTHLPVAWLIVAGLMAVAAWYTFRQSTPTAPDRASGY